MSGTITIPTDAMHDIVAKAVLEQITTEQRDTLIQSALQFLITTPPKSVYGGQQEGSPLQNAFDAAVRSAAHEVVREVVDGELRDRIRDLIREKVTEALEQNSTLAFGIGTAVGDVVERALRGEL